VLISFLLYAEDLGQTRLRMSINPDKCVNVEISIFCLYTRTPYLKGQRSSCPLSIPNVNLVQVMIQLSYNFRSKLTISNYENKQK